MSGPRVVPAATMPARFLPHVETIWRYLVVAEPPVTADVIFVFGSQDFAVPDRAAELYRDGHAPLVLVSGRYGQMTRAVFDQPEAVVFADHLRRAGVDPAAIVPECEAANTLENVTFGLAALRRRESRVASALLVAKPFVMRRCAATFARQAPEIRVRCCPPTTELARAIDRPPVAFAVRLVAELDRLHRYGEAGDIARETMPDAVRAAADRLRALGATP